MKQIVYSHQTVDHETGEVTESKYVKKEVKSIDEFVLLYIDHIGTMAKLPHSELKLLLCLSKHINYEDGDFTLDAKTKEDIVACSGLKEQTIRVCISRLAGKNIIQKVKNGWYKINPSIFWKGSELKRQKSFELTYKWDIKD